MQRFMRLASLALAVLLLSSCPEVFRETPGGVDDETPADDPGDNDEDGNNGDTLSYQVDWAAAGDIGQSDGITFTATVEASGSGALYWGVSNAVAPGIALDGEIDDDGETLVFDDVASDLGAGRLVFAGEATVRLHNDSIQILETRMTIVVADASDEPLELVPAAVDLSLMGIGGALLVYDSGGLLDKFTLSIIAEVKHQDDWVPIAEHYDSLETPADAEEQVRVEYLGIFYEVDG